MCYIEAISADDGLSEIEKFCKYVQGTIPLQRLVYVKRITDTARDCGVSLTQEKLVPFLEKICKDSEHIIRQALAVELQTFGEYLFKMSDDDEKKQSIGYSVAVNAVLPCLNLLLGDPTQEVRDAAAVSILALTSRVCQDDLDSKLLAPILGLLQANSSSSSELVQDEQKSSAITVLNDTSPFIGSTLTRSKIAPELISLSQDPSFRVRKACAQNFGNIARTSGTDFAIAKLLPSYIKLTNDSIWSVRKGCVESLVDIAAAVDKEVRRNTFIPMLTRFTNDVSRWVRNAAYRSLGPFIYTCESDLITPQFLELFTGIPKLNNSLVDAEVNFFCAYNFPAVVARLGASRWNELIPTYHTLCRDTKVCDNSKFCGFSPLDSSKFAKR